MHIDLDVLMRAGRNQPVFAPNGMVATSQPLATQAGMAMLQAGGNAVDAAIATAAALTVVEPVSTSIGGDAFALIWDGDTLHGVNGSGRAPASLTIDEVRSRGHETMPDYGWLTVTVPGAPATWRDVHERFGRLPFAQVLAPAIAYAEDGFPVSPVAAISWSRQVAHHREHADGPEFAHFLDLAAPGGAVPGVGRRWRSAEKAQTLRRIADSYAEDFYTGEIARSIAEYAASTGGFITREDLAAHTTAWVDPIGVNYRGYDVWELPPNGQGIATLMALAILEGYDLRSLDRNSVESFHLQIEAMKLAMEDAFRYVGDPEMAHVPVAGMLSKDYAATRRDLIGEDAMLPAPGEPPQGGTVYLCTADRDGMMVSFIQSAYKGFGSRVVVPELGFSFQNRGRGFSLDPDHPNALAPGKRPFHTIIPGFLTQDGEAIGPFGLMGGFMQAQGHMQMVVNTLDWAMDPQTSIDQPRWQWESGRSVMLEAQVDAGIVEGLRSRGHEVRMVEDLSGFGRGQIIWRLPEGGYVGGSESRTDGQVSGY